MFVMALKNGERKMNQFVPKLFDCMKSYTKEQFVKDVISGIIVAIIALPLSIALALASGVDRKSTRLNSSHMPKSRMPSSA